jgi:hypothetical protein
MAAIAGNKVGVVNGVPNSGTGDASTIDALMADGGQATIGVTTGAAVVTSATGTLQGYLRGIVSLLVSGITVTSHAVTNAGTFAVQAAATLTAETTKVIGVVRLADGSGNLLTSTTNALDLNLKSGVNANGVADPANSAPVINARYAYHTVAASTGPTTMGTGATGDTMMGIYVIPSSTTVGAITLTDNATAITVYAGGTYNADLKPFLIDLMGIKSVSGAWKITTLAGASVIGIGIFT